jgi:hypothetical protein
MERKLNMETPARGSLGAFGAAEVLDAVFYHQQAVPPGDGGDGREIEAPTEELGARTARIRGESRLQKLDPGLEGRRGEIRGHRPEAMRLDELDHIWMGDGGEDDLPARLLTERLEKQVAPRTNREAHEHVLPRRERTNDPPSEPPAAEGPDASIETEDQIPHSDIKPVSRVQYPASPQRR